jgi:hypothetical protein
MASTIPAVQVVAAKEASPVSDYRAAPNLGGELLSAPDFPLWLTAVEVPDGESLEWGEDHGEEVVYVDTGALVDGTRECVEKGAVVLEAGSPARLTAKGDTRVLHFGSRAPTPGRPEDPAVHVVGPLGTWAMVDEIRDSHYFADSTCPTCDVTLLYTSRKDEWDSSTHSHSADEIIHLLWGDIQVGRWHLDPGDTVAIRGDAAYHFRSGPNGFGFLNFRAGPSTMRIPATGVTLVEGGEVNDFIPVMDLR